MKRLNCLICVIAIASFTVAFGCGGDGKDGMDGTSCTVMENADGTHSIECEDGTSVTIPSGEDGEDGESCSVVDNQDGTYDLICPDGTITISDGTDGVDGADGADGVDGADGTGCVIVEKQDSNDDTYYEITCGEGADESSVDIYPPGACTVEENADGTATISCPDGTSVNISEGVDGESCVIENNADPDCFDITCGTETITVCDGEDGESCTVVQNSEHDHCYDITCWTSTVTVCDGLAPIITVEEVAPGAECAEGGFKITTCEDDGNGNCVADTIEEQYACNGTDGTDGTDGVDAEPCTVADNGNGTITISCPDGTSVTITGDVVSENASCEEATEISFMLGEDISLSGNTTGATADAPNSNAEGSALWYRFTVDQPASINMYMTSTDMNQYLYLLKGDCNNWTIVAEVSGGTPIQGYLETGEYIVVTAGVGADDEGSFTLSLHFYDEDIAVLWAFDSETAQIDPDRGYGQIVAGTGLSTPSYFTGVCSDAISYTGWSQTASPEETRCLTFEVNLSDFVGISLSFWARRSSTGPGNVVLHYYDDDAADFVAVPNSVTTVGTSFEQFAFDLTEITALDGNATAQVRICGYNASDSSGTLRFDDVTFTGYPFSDDYWSGADYDTCETAQVITTTGTIYGDTWGATANYPDEDNGVAPATWYKFSVPDGPILASMEMATNYCWNTYFYLLEGDCTNGWTVIAQGTDFIQIELEAGDYIVVTTGVSPADYGYFTLDVDVVPTKDDVVWWTFDGQSKDPDAGSIRSGAISVGSGLTGETFDTDDNSDYWIQYANWSTGDVDPNHCIEFVVNLSDVYNVGFSFSGMKSADGPSNLEISYRTNGTYTIFDTDTTGTFNEWKYHEFDLAGTGIGGETEARIRVCGYNANNSGGEMSFNDVTVTGYVF